MTRLQITTKGGTVIEVTAKTISRDGRRLGFLLAGFDYADYIAAAGRGFLLLPYSTAAGGRGTRRGQYISQIAAVTMQ